LVAIFAAVMDVYTEQNKCRTWICKSMGYAKYHIQLDEHFGHRLRYLYLYRDPRDVVLSFSKAVVGDSHVYSIISKWKKLQEACLAVKTLTEKDVVFEVSYESLLHNKVRRDWRYTFGFVVAWRK